MREELPSFKFGLAKFKNSSGNHREMQGDAMCNAVGEAVNQSS